MGKVLFRNELLVCELEEDKSILKHTWLKKPTSEEFRSNLKRTLEVYNLHKKDFENLKWLADTDVLGELSEDDENWLRDVWDDLLFGQAGVKTHAVILGSDIYADYPMEMFRLSAIQKNSEHGVKLEVFSNAKQAYEWLSEN